MITRILVLVVIGLFCMSEGALAVPEPGGFGERVGPEHADPGISPESLLFDRAGVGPRGQIVGGEVAPAGFWPWAVAVGTDVSFCTGTLIGARYVLTAAHCLFYATEVLVGIGAQDLNSPTLNVVPANDWFPNTGYTPGYNYNDIAIIQLATPVNDQAMRLARLSEPQVSQPGRPALIAGWGDISNSGAFTTVLYQALVPILGDSSCAALYGPNFVAGSMLCAGGEQGVGACFGDSGGPLAVLDDFAIPILAGVTSYGAGCGLGNPDVFTRVAAYTDGIVRFLRANPVAPVGSPSILSTGVARQEASATAAVTETSARITTTIDPAGLATNYRIEYGTGGALDRAAAGYAGAGSTVTVTHDLVGLKPGKQYTFRVVAMSAAGDAAGQVGTFQTKADRTPPRVTALRSSGKVGKPVALKYRVWDTASPKTKETIRVLSGSTVIATVGSRFSKSEQGQMYSLNWRPRYTGTFRFCIVSVDQSKNKSAQSCAAVVVR